MKKLLFLLLFLVSSNIYPYTFIVIGKSNNVGWYKKSKTFVKQIKDLMKVKYRNGELEQREQLEIFPSSLFTEQDYNSYYDCYNFNLISYALLSKIKECIALLNEPINLYCFGQGNIILSLTLLNIINNYSELASYISSDISGVRLALIPGTFNREDPSSSDSTTTQFDSDDLSTVEDMSPIPDHVSENLTQEQYDKLIDIMSEIKSINQKDTVNPNLRLVVKATVAVCGVVTLVITSVVAPVITIIIAL